MTATIPYIEKKFEEFNRQMFGAGLPRIPIVLSNAKTFLGQCTYKRRRTLLGRVELYDFKLRINARIDLSEQELEDTIIHEMIHYYIAYHRLKDTSAHGPLFRRIMEDINTRYGRHLTVSHRSTPEQREQLQDKRRRRHVVAVVAFHDGRTGVKVLPRVRRSILYYYNNVLANREVKAIQLYMSDNIFWNRYPNSSALKVHFLEAEVVKKELDGAEGFANYLGTISKNK